MTECELMSINSKVDDFLRAINFKKINNNKFNDDIINQFILELMLNYHMIPLYYQLESIRPNILNVLNLGRK